MTKTELIKKIVSNYENGEDIETSVALLDKYIYSQNSGKPIVSGSLELLAQLLSREMAKMDNAKTADDIGKARMNMNAVLLVQTLISKSFANDR